MTKTFEQLEALVIEWATQRQIFESATRLSQHAKSQEELNEIFMAILKDDRDELLLEIGDEVVTMILQAKMNKSSVVECLDLAYNKIAERTGKMVDGQFVRNREEER